MEMDFFWIPASAGMTKKEWIPAGVYTCVGRYRDDGKRGNRTVLFLNQI